jgi:hypothetical protein
VWSAPYRHFLFGNIARFYKSPRVDINKPIIIGGGGLFDSRTGGAVHTVVHRNKAPVIIWGAGLNNYHVGEDDRYTWLTNKSASLVGVRDAIDGIGHAPCVSCLHRGFERDYVITQKAVTFEGSRTLSSLSLPVQHCMDGRPIEDIMEFLGSAEVVITSSYHGALWATWLGRRVVVVPGERCSKFYFSPHKWIIREEVPSLENAMEIAESRPSALAIDRELTSTFADKVMQIL